MVGPINVCWTKLTKVCLKISSIKLGIIWDYLHLLSPLLLILLWNDRAYNKQEKGAAAANALQSCPTLCDPIDGSPPGSPVPGIFQARTLEWVAISFSNAWKWKVKVKSLSHVRLFATPWTAAYQAPRFTSMRYSRQGPWSGSPLPYPGKGTTHSYPQDSIFIL